MSKIPYKAANNNTRLTDFSDLKDYVIRNSIKNIPRTINIKNEENLNNSLL